MNDMRLIVRVFDVHGYLYTELLVGGDTYDAKDAIKAVEFEAPEGDKFGTRFRWSHALDEKARVKDRDGCDWKGAEDALDAELGKGARRWRVTWHGDAEEHKERIGHAARILGLRYPDIPAAPAGGKNGVGLGDEDVAPAGPADEDLPF